MASSTILRDRSPPPASGANWGSRKNRGTSKVIEKHADQLISLLVHDSKLECRHRDFMDNVDLVTGCHLTTPVNGQPSSTVDVLATCFGKGGILGLMITKLLRLLVVLPGSSLDHQNNRQNSDRLCANGKTNFLSQ
jgi:hypothetical protein